MVSHEINTTNDKYTEGYKDNAYTTTAWVDTGDGTQFTRDKICNYCKTKVTEKGYQISYNPDGGNLNGSTEIHKEEITPISQQRTILGAPTKAGYEFKRWKTETGTVYQPGDNYNEKNTQGEFVNAVLTAVWKKSKTPPTPGVEMVAVIFDANGGSWSNGETRREYRREVGSVISIESAPMREGYKFLYWKGSEFHPGEDYTVPAGGHTFVAQWEKVEKKPEDKPSAPSVDAKIKTPRGSALTAEEIAKILAGSKKVIPAIPRAGVGR